jgi:pathogenesis-related protein 1
MQLHNQDRKAAGVGPLFWSPTLSDYAQAWADHLGGNGCHMQHRPEQGAWRQQYGENLFIGTAAVFGVDDGYGIWAAEGLFYNGAVISEENLHRIGHYTQIVWRDTREVGCAKALCKDMMLLVCNYNPAGNFLEARPY